MAPIITTSLREYALTQSREWQRKHDISDTFEGFSASADAEMQWLDLQDWCESPDTLQPFDDAEDDIDNAISMLKRYMDDYGDSADIEELRPILDAMDHAYDRILDARALITNVDRRV